jgi:hypothetical protein
MVRCRGPRASSALNPRDLETMRVFAELATKQVHAGPSTPSAIMSRMFHQRS